jgi:carbamoyltransferase
VKAYCDATGDRAVINTSFNRHEEPIVCSPEDAIESLLQNTSDVLSLGDYRVTLPE